MIQSFDAEKVNEISFKKSNKGNIIKIVQEKYLRRDIANGFQPGKLRLRVEPLRFNLEEQEKVFILDDSFILAHFDLIENYPSLLHNLIFMQSTLLTIDKENRTLAAQLRDILEQDSDQRNSFTFLNELHSDTYLSQPQLALLPNSQRLRLKTLKTLEYYLSEAQSDQNFTLQLLVASPQELERYQEAATEGAKRELLAQQFCNSSFFKQHVISVVDVVKMAEDKYPQIINCVNYFHLDDSSGEVALFDSYLEEAELKRGVKEGRLFEGPLLVSRINKNKGTVRVRVLDREVQINGPQCMNRALHGDIVYMELLAESEWISHSKASAAHLVDDEFSAFNVLTSQAVDAQFSGDLNLLEKLNSEAYRTATLTGRIVGILRRPYRSYAGSIIANDKFGLLFLPFNERMSPVRLPQLESQNIASFLNSRYLVKVDTWPLWSHYPLGHLVKLLGNEGEVAVESAVILHEFGIETKPFSKKVLDCLPVQGKGWHITPEERAKRADLCHLPICSVDPPGCKDIDDALHCIKLDNGNYHVGVHIADVTHFVRPGSALDREAARRSTTVYLVEKRTDMLPALLTENLCSLVGQVERLAFSVMWEIEPKTATIVSTEFTKSVIKSKDAMNYKQASEVITSADSSPLAQSLKGLMLISQKLKQRRIEGGALTLASSEVRFRLDDETHNPIDVSSYPTFDTNSMVEEFMLLANISVAERILEDSPGYAVLRRHPPPKPKEIAQFGALLRKLGNKSFSSESSKELAESLDSMGTVLKDENADKVVRMMATRCMHQAQYFSTGQFDYPDYLHYGLAVPLYTHFTSPIRRYADVLVHRLLAKSLDIDSLPNEITNRIKLNRQCDLMNKKTRMAQLASRASADLHAFLLFRNQGTSESLVVEVALISTLDPDEQKAFVHLIKHGLDGELQLPQGMSLFFPSQEEQKEEVGALPISAHIVAGGKTVASIALFQKVRVQVLATEGSLEAGAKRGVKFLYIGLG